MQSDAKLFCMKTLSYSNVKYTCRGLLILTTVKKTGRENLDFVLLSFSSFLSCISQKYTVYSNNLHTK